MKKIFTIIQLLFISAISFALPSTSAFIWIEYAFLNYYDAKEALNDVL